jgi:hypothetical protein
MGETLNSAWEVFHGHWARHLPVVQTLHVLEVHPVSDALHKVLSHSVNLELGVCAHQLACGT